MEPFLTVAMLAQRYSIKRETAGDWLRQGLILGQRVEGRWYTTWDAVFTFEGRLCPPQGTSRVSAKLPLLTVADLARQFSAAEATIRDWLRKGVLPGVSIRGTWYVAPGDLERTCGLEQLRFRKPAHYHTKRQFSEVSTNST